MVRSHWDKIEPVEGKCDWQHFDEALRLAVRHHKQIGLSVAAGVFTPSWVYSKGAKALHFMEPFNGKLRPNVMPAPWDPVFLKAWMTAFDSGMTPRNGMPRISSTSPTESISPLATCCGL